MKNCLEQFFKDMANSVYLCSNYINFKAEILKVKPELLKAEVFVQS